jgi:O-antigen/teichoic acid export membrane protein
VAVVARASGPVMVRQELVRMLDFVVPFAVLGFAVLGAFAPLALRLLYSNSFADAYALFPAILLYQFTAVVYWIIGSPLLATGRAPLWLSLELIAAGTKVGLAIWLVPTLGIMGFPLALFLVGLLHLTLNILCLDRAIKIRMPMSQYARIGLGSVAIIACWWLPTLGLLGIFAAATILLATSAICIKTFRSHL